MIFYTGNFSRALPTKCELAINLQSATTAGIDGAPTLLVADNKVIE